MRNAQQRTYSEMETFSRKKLDHLNSIDDAVQLIVQSRKIVVISGAGISVSCGIPDFRSRDGFYNRIRGRVRDMISTPEELFDLQIFVERPSVFYTFVNDMMHFKAMPSFSHRFLKALDQSGNLLCNYTQNVDTLEQQVGIENVEHCHGSFETFACTLCKEATTCEQMLPYIRYKVVPYCIKCFSCSRKSVTSSASEWDQIVDTKSLGIFKPNIVFFGEGLPFTFNNRTARDRVLCDLLVVIGSSMSVRPICLLPSLFNRSTPLLLINREIVLKQRRIVFDIELLGDCDVILRQICHLIVLNGKKYNANYEVEPFADLLRTRAPDFVPMIQIDKVDDSRIDESGSSTRNHQQIPTRMTRSRANKRVQKFVQGNNYLYIAPNRYIFPGAHEMLRPQDIIHETTEPKRKTR